MFARWSLGSSFEQEGWAAYFMAWANEEIDREMEPVERHTYGQQTYVIQCEETMGVDWMTRAELAQAIPPAYTEYIGRALLDQLRRAA